MTCPSVSFVLVTFVLVMCRGGGGVALLWFEEAAADCIGGASVCCSTRKHSRY